MSTRPIAPDSAQSAWEHGSKITEHVDEDTFFGKNGKGFELVQLSARHGSTSLHTRRHLPSGKLTQRRRSSSEEAQLSTGLISNWDPHREVAFSVRAIVWDCIGCQSVPVTRHTNGDEPTDVYWTLQTTATNLNDVGFAFVGNAHVRKGHIPLNSRCSKRVNKCIGLVRTATILPNVVAPALINDTCCVSLKHEDVHGKCIAAQAHIPGRVPFSEMDQHFKRVGHCCRGRCRKMVIAYYLLSKLQRAKLYSFSSEVLPWLEPSGRELNW
eukprot:6197888-Amphidinium_carterae.1